MNLLANPLNDAQKVWNTVKGGSGKSSNSSALAKSASPDGDSTLSSQGFCFVTPNLIGNIYTFSCRNIDITRSFTTLYRHTLRDKSTLIYQQLSELTLFFILFI